MGEVVTNIRTELLEMLRGVQLHSDQSTLLDAGKSACTVFTQVISFGLSFHTAVGVAAVHEVGKLMPIDNHRISS